jgi:hypothetical protein
VVSTCLHREGNVEQSGLGPRPPDELEPYGQALLVMPDRDGDGRQPEEVSGNGVPDQRGFRLRLVEAAN